MEANFISEIFGSEGNELVDIYKVKSKLDNNIIDLKSSLRTVFDNSFVQIRSLLLESEGLNEEADKLYNQMNLVEEKIEEQIKLELCEHSNELEKLSNSLNEIKLYLIKLNLLSKIDSMIQNIQKNLITDTCSLTKYAELMTEIKNTVLNCSGGLQKIDLLDVLNQEAALVHELLLQKISVDWSKYVKISVNNCVEENMTEVVLCIDESHIKQIHEIIHVSQYLNIILPVEKFSVVLLDEILSKIILHQSDLYFDKSDNSSCTFKFSNTQKKPDYKEMFSNLTTTIRFLQNNFSMKISSGKTFFSVIGEYIANDFAELLINNYLSEIIPDNLNEMNNFKEIVDSAIEFEKTHVLMEFFPEEFCLLRSFSENINVLFANKISQSFLSKAKIIMKKDLYNIVESESISTNLNFLSDSFKTILKEKMNLYDDVFIFPKSQIRAYIFTVLSVKLKNQQNNLCVEEWFQCLFHPILGIGFLVCSKHARELVELINFILMDIKNSSNECSVRLLYTVRNIFEMYVAVVPLHHKKFLESFPQQVALLHNNCFYFAHYLINLVGNYLPLVKVFEENFTILLEQALVLRSLAVESLEKTVSDLQRHLITILEDSGLNTLNGSPKLDPNAEKAVRQVCRQIQLLQTVWKNVLPITVYNRVMGFLVDAFIEGIISFISLAEDISSQAASDLESCFVIIQNRCPSIFLDEKEVFKHSRKWMKFQEFVRLIKGSLRDIDSRWADGLGPLAAEFTPYQIKHLIRALFQNSDKRAALLAKIK